MSSPHDSGYDDLDFDLPSGPEDIAFFSMASKADTLPDSGYDDDDLDFDLPSGPEDIAFFIMANKADTLPDSVTTWTCHMGPKTSTKNRLLQGLTGGGGGGYSSIAQKSKNHISTILILGGRW